MVDYLSNGRMLPALGSAWTASGSSRRRGCRSRARPAHRRGDPDHAAMLERGRGHLRRGVLAARPHQRLAEARPAAHAALDRREQRGGHAARRAARGRLDPVVHHAGAIPGRRREDADVRRRGRPRLEVDHFARSSTTASIPTRRLPARWPTRSSRGAASTTPRSRAAPRSARPRACGSTWRRTSRAAPRSSSCARCARPSGCWTSSPSWPTRSCPRSTAGRPDGRQSSTCAPSSTTRSGGILKYSIAERALRVRKPKRSFRHFAIGAGPVGSTRVRPT